MSELLEAAAKHWHRYKRWHEADRKGWRMLGRLIATGNKDPNCFECRWLVRNGNRLYRLTRGHGNPWIPHNGF